MTMAVRCVLAVLAVVASATGATAQQWAEKTFDTLKHDFGQVANGSKQEFHFKFKNLYKEDLHIASVTKSCGCVEVRWPQDQTFKTFETGEIVAEFQTRTFRGQHGANITVTFDKPYFAQVRLRIDGYIRSDVVFEPPFVDLGSVDAGSASQTKKVHVKYNGRPDWEIQDVTSSNDKFEVELSKPRRIHGTVEYDLQVRLKEGAAPGTFRDVLNLVTNDSGARIPLSVEGRVVPDVEVSPAQLYFGDVKPGESVQKTLLVRAKKPVKVTGCDCEDPRFALKPTEKPATLHKVPVTFVAGEKPGRAVAALTIKTDSAHAATVQVQVYANVIADQVAKQ